MVVQVSVWSCNKGVCVFFQLSVLTGVRYLQTSLENVLRQGDPNSESDGWLLENSFMETARTNLNIIKSLGKSNQIDTADNGDPNINVPSSSKAHYGPDNVPPKQIPEASWPLADKKYPDYLKRVRSRTTAEKHLDQGVCMCGNRVTILHHIIYDRVSWVKFFLRRCLFCVTVSNHKFIINLWPVLMQTPSHQSPQIYTFIQHIRTQLYCNTLFTNDLLLPAWYGCLSICKTGVGNGLKIKHGCSKKSVRHQYYIITHVFLI